MTVRTPATNRGFSGPSLVNCVQLPGFVAGQKIFKMTPCMADTDGKIYPCNSASYVALTAGTAASGSVTYGVSSYVGFTKDTVQSAEEGVTLFRGGCAGDYSTGMTPGEFLYVCAVSGSLASGSPVVGLDRPVAVAISSTRIVVL